MEVNQEATQLCYSWGKVRDQGVLILFDPGSTHNLISLELAQKLGIKTEELGPPLDAFGAFKGQQVPVTPLIGKLRLHVQEYVDQEEFYVSPLLHEDVILGAPWFHRMAAQLKFPDRVISFHHRGRAMSLCTKEKGSTIPIVSHVSIQKAIKSSLFSYMVFVKDSLPPHDTNSQESNTNSCSNDEMNHMSFLQTFSDCFSDSIPNELPPTRGEDDHRIELVPGTSPPNRPPYRVSHAQQEEILSQVNELLEKGMVRPSSSPFSAKKRWVLSNVCGLLCTK